MDFRTWPPKVLVVDTEGSGASPPDLVEVAAVPVTAGTVRADAIRQSLVRPPRPVTPRAAAMNGLTNEVLAHAPVWETIAPRVRADLDGAWIVAHNATVDYRLLARLLPGWEPAGLRGGGLRSAAGGRRVLGTTIVRLVIIFVVVLLDAVGRETRLLPLNENLRIRHVSP